MTKLSSFFVLFLLAAPVCVAQTTPAQIDRTWLTVDTTKPMPAGPVDPPAFARATTVAARLLQGLGSGETDSVRFVANKAGSYMIFCAVPGHGLAGMWIRLKVSATEKRPTLTSSSS